MSLYDPMYACIFVPQGDKSGESHKVASSPVDNLKVLRNVSSIMTLKQIRSCIGGLEGFKIQNKGSGILSPYWGLFIQIANKLPSKYLDKIRSVIYLKDFGDISKPTSAIVKLDPKDYIKVRNRWVRAIKIKGVSNRVVLIKKGKFRYIRFLGQGNIPFLLPYTNTDGTREDFRFDVGEPYSISCRHCSQQLGRQYCSGTKDSPQESQGISPSLADTTEKSTNVC